MLFPCLSMTISFLMSSMHHTIRSFTALLLKWFPILPAYPSKEFSKVQILSCCCSARRLENGYGHSRLHLNAPSVTCQPHALRHPHFPLKCGGSASKVPSISTKQTEKLTKQDKKHPWEKKQIDRVEENKLWTCLAKHKESP